MSDIIEKYENPCDGCMHRVNSHCKAYKYPIKILDVNKCKRRKIKVQCKECNSIWDKKELLYEPLLKMYKCPKCRIFTPLISLAEI